MPEPTLTSCMATFPPLCKHSQAWSPRDSTMQSHFTKLQWPASNMASSVARHLSVPTVSYVQRLPRAQLRSFLPRDRTSPYSRISCMARTVAPENHARPPTCLSRLEPRAPCSSRLSSSYVSAPYTLSSYSLGQEGMKKERGDPAQHVPFGSYLQQLFYSYGRRVFSKVEQPVTSHSSSSSPNTREGCQVSPSSFPLTPCVPT